MIGARLSGEAEAEAEAEAGMAGAENVTDQTTVHADFAQMSEIFGEKGREIYLPAAK